MAGPLIGGGGGGAQMPAIKKKKIVFICSFAIKKNNSK